MNKFYSAVYTLIHPQEERKRRVHPAFHSCILLQVLLFFLLRVDGSVAQPLLCYFGDSITEGWIDGELHPRLAFPSISDSILRVNHPTLLTYHSGRSGETTLDALTRIDSDILAQQPSIVVVSFGSNDYYIHGNSDSPRISEVQFYRNLEMICRKLLGTGSRPVLLGLPPADGKKFYTFSPVHEPLYEQYGGVSNMNRRYDTVIRQKAIELGIPYVAVDFGDSVEIDSMLGVDGVHPTANGHRRISEVLVRVVDTLLDSASVAGVTATASLHVYPSPFVRSRDSFITMEVQTQAAGTMLFDCFDIHGRLLDRMMYDAVSPGRHYVLWPEGFIEGTGHPAGAYIIRMRSGNSYAVRNILIH